MNFIKKLIKKLFNQNSTDEEPVVAPTAEQIDAYEPPMIEEDTAVEVAAVEGVVEEPSQTPAQISFDKAVHKKYTSKYKRLAKRREKLKVQKDASDAALEKYDDDAYIKGLIKADQKDVAIELAEITMMQTVSEDEFRHYMQLKSAECFYANLIKMLTARKRETKAQMSAFPEPVQKFAKGVSPVLPSDLQQTVQVIEDKVSGETTGDENIIV